MSDAPNPAAAAAPSANADVAKTNVSKADKKKGKKKGGDLDASMAGLTLSAKPAFIEERLSFFEELVERRKKEALERNEEITVTVVRKKAAGNNAECGCSSGGDNNNDAEAMETVATVTGLAGVLTGIDVAKEVDKAILADAITTRVDGVVFDIARPLEASCRLEFVTFEDPDGKHVFWHSSSHVLGQALENTLGAHLSHGPPLEEGGFFYDSYVGENGDAGGGSAAYNLKPADVKAVEKEAAKIVKEKQPFQRLEVTKEEGLELFKYNRFKVEMLTEKVPEGARMTVYRCGNLIDPCRGPHVSSTGRIKAFELTKTSSSFFKGDAERDAMQRVYGIAFPDKGSLKEWKEFVRLAAERDHRKIGTEQELFFFSPLSPGSCFFLPRGTRIYNRLVELIRSEYQKRGYQEVVTPNMYNADLWRTSGHWQHYQDDMFTFPVEGQDWALKPMNCPGHCLMFDQRPRSWRELPWRVADFGVLHRNESSGALTGLTRVRRFQQDDAHIFCTPSQIGAEVDGVLDFMRRVYQIFGFTFRLALSTRPEKALGEKHLWDNAEKLMAEALDRFGEPWSYNHGDGAFYGPKIDIEVFDALRRKHQCATIQLDFQLPIRFDLAYVSDDTTVPREDRRPVMIHRAILGSVERLTAILCEHTGGKWPLWLSPHQVVVVPISDLRHGEVAIRVRDEIRAAGFFAEADVSGATFNKKIRNAQVSGANYILVLGDKEVEEGLVNVRSGRSNEVLGAKAVPEFVAMMRELVDKWE